MNKLQETVAERMDIFNIQDALRYAERKGRTMGRIQAMCQAWNGLKNLRRIEAVEALRPYVEKRDRRGFLKKLRSLANKENVEYWQDIEALDWIS